MGVRITGSLVADMLSERSGVFEFENENERVPDVGYSLL